MNDIYSPGSLAVMQRVKTAVDPANLFGANNHGVSGTVALTAE
jgi:hypothetical protein